MCVGLVNSIEFKIWKHSVGWSLHQPCSRISSATSTDTPSNDIFARI